MKFTKEETGRLVDYLANRRAFLKEVRERAPEYGEAVDNLVDFACQDQTREVDEHRSAHACTGVGGTGGEVAEVGIVVELEEFANFVFVFDGDIVGAFGIEARREGLDAKVVFLVDHDRGAFIGSDKQRFGKVAAVEEDRRNQVTFDEEVAVEFADIGGFVILSARERF